MASTALMLTPVEVVELLGFGVYQSIDMAHQDRIPGSEY